MNDLLKPTPQSITYQFRADGYAKTYLSYCVRNVGYILDKPAKMDACSMVHQMMAHSIRKLTIESRPFTADAILDAARDYPSFPKMVEDAKSLRMMVDNLLQSYKDYVDEAGADDAVEQLEALAIDHKIAVGAQNMHLIAISDATTAEKMSKFESLTSLISDDYSKPMGAQLSDLMMDHLKWIEDDTADTIEIMSTGFPSLDRAISGLKKGEITLVFARPSHGKSTLGTQIGINVARKKKRVMYLTLELTKNTLNQFILKNETGWSIDDQDVKKKPRNYQEVIRFSNELKEYCFQVEDDGGMTFEGLETAIIKFIRIHGGLDLLVIDFIQLMTHPNPKLTEQERISENMIQIKRIAKKYMSAVLVVAQSKRDADHRAKDQRPVMADIKGSGRLEELATHVIALHRESMNQPDNLILARKAELFVLKNRLSPFMGTVVLGWDTSRGCFNNNPPTSMDEMYYKKEQAKQREEENNDCPF